MKTEEAALPPTAHRAESTGSANTDVNGVGHPPSAGRREVLGFALAVLGAPLFLPAASPFLVRPAVAAGAKARSCIVIGAGLAGLSAAYKLRRAGWRVTVLEARDRLGGRVLSYRPPENKSLVCELGAEWVGENHERMRALCREFNLALQVHRFKTALLQNGRVMPPGTWRFSPESEKAWTRFAGDFSRYHATPARATRPLRLVDMARSDRLHAGRPAPARPARQHRFRREHPPRLGLCRGIGISGIEPGQ